MSINQIDLQGWLENPYREIWQAEQDWAYAEEEVRENNSYDESLNEWLEENPDSTESDYLASSRYTALVETQIRNWNQRKEW